MMKIPFGKVGSAAMALIGKFPAQKVSSNLHPATSKFLDDAVVGNGLTDKLGGCAYRGES